MPFHGHAGLALAGQLIMPELSNQIQSKDIYGRTFSIEKHMGQQMPFGASCSGVAQTT